MKILNQETDCEDEEDNQNSLADGPPNHKKSKFEVIPILPDNRKWTQKHIKAVVNVPQSVALTPPQDNTECMDVDARGPGTYTFTNFLAPRFHGNTAFAQIPCRQVLLTGCMVLRPTHSFHGNMAHSQLPW
ncbi:neurogenic locus notch homolog protein 1-like [Chiloscyllium punctatum]|uniref:neurogenic locus notch homolog protein 1-like n=1 Tax=Chiloscyllium punctatum TaxID=137246 RepID=UPI003B635249